MGEIVIDDMLSYDWYEDIITSWENKLLEYGFIEPKIFFNGFYSQGDGAVFDFSNINLKIVYEKFNLELNLVSELNENNQLTIFTCKNNFANHYSHEKTRYISFNIDLDCIPDYDTTFSIINSDIKKLEDIRLDLCKEIYNELQTHYEELESLVLESENFKKSLYDRQILFKLSETRIYNGRVISYINESNEAQVLTYLKTEAETISKDDDIFKVLVPIDTILFIGNKTSTRDTIFKEGMQING